MGYELTLGARYLGEGRCRFLVWAPLAGKVEVRLASPHERLVEMSPLEGGYHEAEVEGVEPGCLYLFRLDGQAERPDPASRSQPRGVHGPSELTDPAFPWEDASWRGLPLKDYVLYELHVGTFTDEGTFEAAIPRMGELRELGVTAVELMPVSQFPGGRNWGYDGVYPFAAQDSYGGPEGLKRLVNACHLNGMAVVLDVVYNHLGPEGNYLWDFGPYFTERYKTPWGAAVNFDGPESDEVRRYFAESALSWVEEFRIDALRIDAIHGIFDFSARTFLEELGLAVQTRAEELERHVYLIPESDLNDSRFVRSRELGGLGLDAQWNDDFHHALHTLLTGERSGYYQDFGSLHHLLKAYREGFVYSGERSAYRRRRHGSPSRDIPAHRFVVFSQNHDQVGNRLKGDRLSQTLSLEGLKLAAGAVILSPFIPLIFMGEEYGETAPFQYFISHGDPALVEAVRRGRREEFAAFRWEGEPPDPQDEATFLRAKLDHGLKSEGRHALLLDFHKELIRLRKETRPLSNLSKEHMEVEGFEAEKVMLVRRWVEDEEAACVLNFSGEAASVSAGLSAGRWLKRLDSADKRWQGPGSRVAEEMESAGEVSLKLAPLSIVLLMRED